MIDDYMGVTPEMEKFRVGKNNHKCWNDVLQDKTEPWHWRLRAWWSLKTFHWQTMWNWKVMLSNEKYNLEKHCSKGYHRIKSQYLGVKRPGWKRMKIVRYYECTNCETKFFNTVADKKKYENLNGRSMEEMLARLKENEVKK